MKNRILEIFCILLSLAVNVFADGGANPPFNPGPAPADPEWLFDQIFLEKVVDTDSIQGDTGAPGETEELAYSLELKSEALYASNIINSFPLVLTALSSAVSEETQNDIFQYFGPDGTLSDDGWYYPDWLEKYIYAGGFTGEENDRWFWMEDHHWLFGHGIGYDSNSLPTNPQGYFGLYDLVFNTVLHADPQQWKAGWFYSDIGSVEGWYFYEGKDEFGRRVWFSDDEKESFVEPVTPILLDFDVSESGDFYEVVSTPVKLTAQRYIENLDDYAPASNVEIRVSIHEDENTGEFNANLTGVSGKFENLYGGENYVYIRTNSEGEAKFYVNSYAGVGGNTSTIKAAVEQKYRHSRDYFRSSAVELQVTHEEYPFDYILFLQGYASYSDLTYQEETPALLVKCYEIMGPDLLETSGETLRVSVHPNDVSEVEVRPTTSLNYSNEIDILTDSDSYGRFVARAISGLTSNSTIEVSLVDSVTSETYGKPIEFSLLEISELKDCHLILTGDEQVASSDSFLVNPVRVQLLDRFAQPLVGRQIRFVAATSNGSLSDEDGGSASSEIDITTDVNGNAEAWLKVSGDVDDVVYGYAYVLNSNDEAFPVPFKAKVVATDTESGYEKDYQLRIVQGYGQRGANNQMLNKRITVTATSPVDSDISTLSARFSINDPENADGEFYFTGMTTASELTLSFSETASYPSVAYRPSTEFGGMSCDVLVELLDEEETVIDSIVVPIKTEYEANSEPEYDLKIIEGDLQAGLANRILTKPLAVRVSDSEGMPVEGAEVGFIVEEGNGLFTLDNLSFIYHDPSSSVVTNSTGIAHVYFLQSNSTYSRVIAYVKSPLGDPATDPVWFTTVVFEPNEIEVTTDPESGLRFAFSGMPEKNRMQVVVRRYNGEVVSGIPVTFEIDSTSDVDGVLSDSPFFPMNTTSLTVLSDVSGVAEAYLNPDFATEPNKTIEVNVKAVFGELESNLVNFTFIVRSYGNTDEVEFPRDGLPDSWEKEYLGAYAEGPLDDTDQDGLTNIQEYLLNTDPLDSTFENIGDEFYELGENSEVVAKPSGILSTLESVVSTSQNGAMEIAVPLPILPGIKETQPEIALQYNSQRGNGIMGMGWTMSGLSSITRGPRTPAVDGYASGVNFTTEDAFYLDGTRLILVSGTAGQNNAQYRTELDSQQIITYKTDSTNPYFLVETKSGLTLTYGKNTDARYSHGSVSRTSGYLLERVEDRFGNFYIYNYNRPQSTDRPIISSIKYTGVEGQSGDPANEISFIYEYRPDVFFGYAHGYEAKNRHRLKAIEVKSNNNLWRQYRLKYILSPETQRSLLKGIVTYAADGTYLMPTSFNWSVKADEKGWVPWSDEQRNHGFVNINDDVYPWFIADINNDGLSDLIQIEAENNDWSLNHYISDISGIEEFATNANDSSWDSVDNGALSFFQYTNVADNDFSDQSIQFFQGDFDGDGRPDFCKFNHDDGSGDPHIYIVKNQGGSNPTWTYTSDLVVKNSGGTVIPKSQYPGHSLTYPSMAADFNGDGYTDIMIVREVNSDPNNKRVEILLYQFQPDSSIVLTKQLVDTDIVWAQVGNSSDKGQRWRLGDFNGDGLIDILRFANGDTDQDRFEIFWNKYDAATNSHIFDYDIQNLTYEYDENTQRLHPADINGDGISDVILIARDKVIYFTSKGFLDLNTDVFLKQEVDYTLIEVEDGSINPNTGPGVDWRLGDFYGDGYIDLLQIYPSGLEQNRPSIIVYNLLPPSQDQGYRMTAEELFIDDFAPELTEFETIGFKNHEKQDSSPKFKKFPRYPYVADFTGDGKADLFLATQTNESTAGAGRKFHRWGSVEPTTTDIISTVTNGLSVQTNVEYAPLTNVTASIYTKGTDASTRIEGGIDIVNAAHVVKRITRDTGLGTVDNPVQSKHEYTYEGLAASVKRGMLGFRKIIVKDNYNEELITRTTTTYSQNYPFTGNVEQSLTEVFDGGVFKLIGKSAAAISAREIKEIWVDPNLNTRKVLLPIEEVYTKWSYELDGSLVSKTKTTTRESDIDEWGNVKKVTEQVSTTEAMTVETTFTTETLNTCLTSADGKRFGRLETSTVTKTRPGVQHGGDWSAHATSVRKSSFEYNSDLVLYKETVEPDATGNNSYLKLTTEYSYTSEGNIYITSVYGYDSMGAALPARTSTSVYTADKRFVDTATDALGHDTTFTYNSISGTVDTVTDMNGLVTTNTYDSYDRLMKVDSDGGSPAHTRRMRARDVVGPGIPSGAISAVKTWSESAPDAPQITFYDRLGRELRTATVAGDGEWLLQDKTYSARGLVEKSSRVYKEGTALDSTLDYSIAYYDTLGRVVLQTSPGGGAIGFSYYGTNTEQYQIVDGALTVPGTVTAATVKAAFQVLPSYTYSLTSAVTDAMGQKISIEDNAGYELLHYYDADGNLISTATPKLDGVGDIVANEATFNYIGYDRRGNKTVMVDPNMGTWYYVYNSFGELTHQYDAVGNLIYFEYDNLGRQVLRSDFEYNEVSEDYDLVESTIWEYDGAVNGLGLIEREYILEGASTVYEKTYAYDEDSRLEEVSEVLQGDTYTFEYTYDTHGRLLETKYPNGILTTRQNYGTYGQLDTVTKVLENNVATSDVIWEAEEYDSLGSISQYELGNGLTTRLTRSQRLGYVTQIRVGTTDANANRMNLELGYHVSGSLKDRHDFRRNLHEAFTYDSLRRLNSVELTTDFNQPEQVVHDTTYCHYDALGNLRGRSTTAHGQMWMGYDPDAIGTGTAIIGGPNAIVTAFDDAETFGWAYRYNGNGSLVQQWDITDTENWVQMRNYTWTAFNKPAVMTNYTGGITTSAFSYGTGRQRIRQLLTRADSSVRDTLYVSGGLYEKELNDPDGTATALTTTERAFVPTPTGNAAVVIRETDTSTSSRTEYLHEDHQGSLNEVTNQSGATVASYSYDAWGEQRDPDDWLGLPQSGQSPEEDVLYVGRSYTGHEPLQDFGLVHMNGRIYDPIVGRFLSSDPFVQFPDDLQGHNRYTYVLNNPLSYTDPSGYFLQFAIPAIIGLSAVAVHTDDPLVRSLAGIAIGALTFGALTAPASAGGLGLSSWAAAPISGAVVGGINDGLQGAAIGAVSALAFHGIGSAFAGSSTSLDSVAGAVNYATKTVAHGIVGGTMTLAYGGDFAQGFLSTAVTQAFSGPIGNILPDAEYFGVMARTAAAAALGGTISQVSGGSFANGAITGAFSRLFNDEIHLEGYSGERYSEHDELIQDLVNDFNSNKEWYAGGGDNWKDIPDLTPELVKSWMIQESGGNDARSLAAWAVDPAQVNVPGDWSSYKADLGLIKPTVRNQGNIKTNLKASIAFLTRKGFGSSGQPMSNRPSGTFDGWNVALQRYNGRSVITTNGLSYRANYANRIINRASNPGDHYPIQLPKPK